jgi:hypothetical protein
MNKRLIDQLREGFDPSERSKLQVKAVTPDKNQGINVNHWFWAAMDSIAPQGKRESHHTHEGSTDASTPPASPPSPDATPEELIAQNPGISAATFLNLLKSKGYEFSQKEADASSTLIAQNREGAAPQQSRPNGFSFRTRLVEASYQDDGIGPTKFRVILLKEGMGNARDAYYYSKDALVSAVPVFEGKKIYSDHPSLTDEEVRPERSVRDILGYFENVAVEELPDGCSALMGDVNIMPDKPFEWARALLRNSVDYAKKFPDKEFVGLSINANGDAQEASIQEVLKSAPAGAKDKLAKAIESGTSSVRVVSKIDEAVSCDLVTEAGAGGKIISLLEADQMKVKEATGVAPGLKEDEAKEAKGLAPEMKEDESKEAFPPKKDGEDKEPDADDEKKEDGEKHDDEAQDKELIKKMLDQHLGKDQHGEEECASAHEAMKCAMENGETKEAAMQMAGSAMKMAKFLQKKKEAVAEAEEKKESEDKSEPKESAVVLKLKGENAKLKESLASIEVEKHVDATLRDSGLRMEITKKFRESCGKFKSTKDFDEKFKLFVEGYRSIGGEADSYDWLATATEKAVSRTGENGLVDLSDC